MRRVRIWRHRLRSIFKKDTADEGLARELAFHLDQLVAENIAAGLPSEQARQAALRTFGNLPLLAEESRDQRRVGWLHDLWQDAAYGWRLLRSNLRFTLVAVASLALGIGANTTILGTLAVALRGEIPILDADRLVLIGGYTRQRPAEVGNSTVPEYLAWKERLHSFSAIGLSIANRQDLTGDGVLPERLTGQGVTASLFRAVRESPILGRTLTQEEGNAHAPARVIVLSYRLWQRLFGGDPGILNRSVRLDGQPWTVIGVMPSGFWYPHEACEYWIPLGFTREQMQASAWLFAVTARLKDGISRQEAQAEVASVSAALAHEFPEGQRDWRAHAVPVRERWFGWLNFPLAMLEAAGAMVLLIVCTNVGALLLARATARKAEFAMRIALGASRTRLIRQILAESLLLSGIGGVCSLAVAWGCAQLLTFMQPPPGGAHAGHLTLDAPAATIAVLLSLISGLAAGAGPVLWGLRPGTSLRETAEEGRTGWRSTLVVVQLSLALMLLIASGLLTKSLFRRVSTDLGYEVNGLLAFDFRIPPQQYLRAGGTYQGMPVGEAQTTSAVLKRVHDRLREIPGVESVAGVTSPPVNALVVPVFTILVEGRPSPATPEERNSLAAVHLSMTPGYFRTVRAVVAQGRDIAESDTAAAPWVVVINESMARRFWPGEDPIGKRFTFDVAGGEQPRTVVGVVRDMQQMLGGLGIRSVVYTSYQQQPAHYRGPFANQYGQMTFVLRGPGDPSKLVPTVRRAVAEIEPNRPISNIMRLSWWGGAGTINQGLNAAVIVAFALVAMLLACIGVYGVTAYSLSQRTREVGIRIALGARFSEILTLLCRQAAWLIAISVLIGGTGALALTRLLNFELGHVSAYDPAIYVGAILLLALVALASSFAPARAAREISPAIALRAE